MLKCTIVQKTSKPGGKTDERNFNLEVPENVVALLAKCSPAMEKFIMEYTGKMFEEQSRHNQVFEQLERDRFEHQKEQDEKNAYWRSEYERVQKERDEVQDKLRATESELWDYQHGLKRPDDDDEGRSA